MKKSEAYMRLAASMYPKAVHETGGVFVSRIFQGMRLNNQVESKRVR